MQDENQQLAIDPVFTLRSNNIQDVRVILERTGWRSQNTRPLFALTPRWLRGGDGESHTHYPPQSALNNQKEIDVFASVLDWLWKSGYQPIFIPMNTIVPDDDRVASQQIIDKAKYGEHALLVDEQVPPRDAANVYHFCKAAFVSRVHGAVTAFLGSCPALMYAFDLKHTGIMEQMELSDYVFNPEANSAKDAIEMLGEMLQTRSRIIAQMEKKSRELQKQAKVPQEAVLSLLDGGIARYN